MSMDIGTSREKFTDFQMPCFSQLGSRTKVPVHRYKEIGPLHQSHWCSSRRPYCLYAFSALAAAVMRQVVPHRLARCTAADCMSSATEPSLKNTRQYLPERQDAIEAALRKIYVNDRLVIPRLHNQLPSIETAKRHWESIRKVADPSTLAQTGSR